MVLSSIVLPAEQPILETPRLRLRPMRAADAPRVQALAGDIEVARSTELIPHPYPDGVAEAWIESHPRLWREAREAVWAIVWRERDDELIGALSLHFALARRTATAGYWVGRAYWGQGVASEALRAAVACAFDRLGLNRASPAPRRQYRVGPGDGERWPALGGRLSRPHVARRPRPRHGPTRSSRAIRARSTRRAPALRA